MLFVEDDEIIASGLVYALSQEGYAVTHFVDAEKALAAVGESEFSLAILDISLPDGSGYDICQALKAKGDTPVIFLTAVDDEGNAVKGLEMGADDYITKPFRIRELLARIKSVLRRANQNTNNSNDNSRTINIGNIQINTSTAKVYKNGDEIILTALEYRLLLIFANNEGQVLSRNQLLEGIWDAAGNFVNDNTLTVYIKRLREKLEDDSQNPTLIRTVRGLGYKVGE